MAPRRSALASNLREVNLGDAHPGCGLKGDERDEHGDLIIGIDVPASATARRSHYLKVRERASYEFALVSAAAAVALDGDRIREARLALGGVAPKPWRLRAAEEALTGAALDARDLRRAVDRAFLDARPLAHNGFKVELAKRTAVRALQTAGGRA